MGKEYYYFASSLPSIYFDSEPPMSCDEYLKECERHIPVRDYHFMKTLFGAKVLDYAFLQKLIRETRGEIKSHNKAFQQGVLFNRSFRNEVAAFRAQRLGKDPNNYIRGDRHPSLKVLEVINQADKAPDLLEGEKILDKFRWEFFDELQCQHYFDIEYLTIYGLKLQILEKYKEVRSSKGEEIFDEFQKMDVSSIIK